MVIKAINVCAHTNVGMSCFVLGCFAMFCKQMLLQQNKPMNDFMHANMYDGMTGWLTD